MKCSTEFIKEAIKYDEPIDLNQKYFYHATFGPYLDQIKKEGLKPNSTKSWEDSNNPSSFVDIIFVEDNKNKIVKY